jgi:hypothetical protein
MGNGEAIMDEKTRSVANGYESSTDYDIPDYLVVQCAGGGDHFGDRFRDFAVTIRPPQLADFLLRA